MQTVKVKMPNGSELHFPAEWEQEKWRPVDHPDWTFIRLNDWFALPRSPRAPR